MIGYTVLTSVEIVAESIPVGVLNQLSVLIVGSLGILRKTASYHLWLKIKARLETTFIIMKKARSRSTWYM